MQSRRSFNSREPVTCDSSVVITRSVAGELIDARVCDSLLSGGEWVAVRFRDRDVWIVSICDPRIGFSLVARTRCRHYTELIKGAVRVAA
jgi:hypothetical protein